MEEGPLVVQEVREEGEEGKEEKEREEGEGIPGRQSRPLAREAPRWPRCRRWKGWSWAPAPGRSRWRACRWGPCSPRGEQGEQRGRGEQLPGQNPGGAPSTPPAGARPAGARQVRGAEWGEGVGEEVEGDLEVVGGGGPGVQVHHVPLPRLEHLGEAGLEGPAPG